MTKKSKLEEIVEANIPTNGVFNNNTLRDVVKDCCLEYARSCVPEGMKGEEKPDCGDATCPCGGTEWSEYDSGFNACREEILNQIK